MHFETRLGIYKLRLSETGGWGFGNDAKVDAKPNSISSTDFSKGFHSMRYKSTGPTRDLTSFATHRGVMRWAVASMGTQSSPAMYVAAVTRMLNEYGLCAGSRCDKSMLTDAGRKMHEIFSSNTGEYGDWTYKDYELSTPEDNYNFVLSYIDDTCVAAQDLRQMDRRLNMLAYCATR